MKKYIAEFFGTFTLAMAVLASLSSDSGLATALLAGITLGISVYTIGKVSGAHINPAVTLGAWSVGKIEAKEVFPYILSQFAGSAVALIIGKVIGLVASVDGSFSGVALTGEIVGTLIFTFGIASVLFAKELDLQATDTEVNTKAPFVIGGSLTLGASIAGALGSNGVLNPAVAFGIGSFGWAYALGPIIGALLGMWLYKFISMNANSKA